MRFSTFAFAIVGASLVQATIASTVETNRIAKDEAKQRGNVRREDMSEEEKERRKYFHEPGYGPELGHYDRRYYSGIVSDEVRTETQLYMIHAYLDFFRENGLDTWIAHGTLLGWWWNGKRLPWDWDLDTQVSDTTLFLMGEKYNQTRYKYKPSDTSPER